MLSNAREEILGSIRKHLAASGPFDAGETNDQVVQSKSRDFEIKKNTESLIELFAESLEAVDGHCVIVNNEQEVIDAVRRILVDLRATRLSPKRMAVSDADEIRYLVESMSSELDEVAKAPS